MARVLAGRAPPLPDAAAMAADAAASYEALERAGLPVRYTHCQARPRGMSSAHFLLTCALHALPGAPPAAFHVPTSWQTVRYTHCQAPPRAASLRTSATLTWADMGRSLCPCMRRSAPERLSMAERVAARGHALHEGDLPFQIRHMQGTCKPLTARCAACRARACP